MNRSTRSVRQRAEDAAAQLRQRIQRPPQIAMLLGSGRSAITGRLKGAQHLHSDDLPEGMSHRSDSQLVAGELEGVEVIIADAPRGVYEGYSPEQVTFPVRVMRALGAETLMLTAAGASICSQLEAGHIARIEDHINLSGTNPLHGPNDDELGPRAPDMSMAYDPHLLRIAREVAIEIGIPCLPGVFACTPGPSLPTRAEYRFLSRSGADVVGVSLVPEVIAAVHSGFSVLALIGITQKVAGDSYPVDLESLVEAADLAAPRMASLLSGIVASLA